jgi:hypothetical protein
VRRPGQSANLQWQTVAEAKAKDRQTEVKGLTLMDNSIFNSWRMEDVWLDR